MTRRALANALEDDIARVLDGQDAVTDAWLIIRRALTHPRLTQAQLEALAEEFTTIRAGLDAAHRWMVKTRREM